MALIVFVLLVVSTVLTENYTGALQYVGAAIAIADVVFYAIGLSKLSKSFGHGGGFTAGLFFFEPLFTIILGFSKAKYVGNTTENK